MANRSPIGSAGILRAVRFIRTDTTPALGTEGMAIDITVVRTLLTRKQNKIQLNLYNKISLADGLCFQVGLFSSSQSRRLSLWLIQTLSVLLLRLMYRLL